MRFPRLDFCLSDAPVGSFHYRAVPTAPGRYPFEPYRGEGLTRLAASLAAGHAVECWFARGGRRVVFAVVREELVEGPPSAWFLEVSKVADGGPHPRPSRPGVAGLAGHPRGAGFAADRRGP